MKTKKILALALAAVLLVAVSVAGTVAYLTAVTDEVTNTFTAAGIAIDLKETKNSDGSEEARVTDWSAKLVPGVIYPKNPSVTLTKADCDVYLFITVNPVALTGFVEYSVDETIWTPLQEGVWYKAVTKEQVGQSWDILVDNQVKISEGLTSANMIADDATLTITFDAFAVQQAAGTAAQAWALVNP